ncbi:MAG TPA: serine/threonine-protein kinase, partial [Ktedonobacteraceae bacterium]|nr:serine/threonine-protein kinase [Ktedonobacteraceae bacterium]
VREYLPHESLRSRLRTLSPDRLQLREVLMIVSQVGQALAYAHKHDILHGNLKPENIFLDAYGEALLTDFSLLSRNDAIFRDQTTEEYAFCYLAPEQFAGTSDARSDQYALGCLAYELISGHVPFAAQTLASLMGHQNNILPSPLSESIADLPPSLETALLKTLAKDPAERFFDFSLFLEVVQSVLVQPPAFPLFPSLDSPRPRITFRRTSRRPKARTVLSSVHQITASSSPPSELPDAEVIEQLEERLPLTTKSVSDQKQTDTKFSISQKTTNDGPSKSSTDRVRKPSVGEISSSQSHNDLDQTRSQEDADDLWLTNLFEEQEINDLPAKGSASLEHELHEPGRETSNKMIVSQHGNRPVSRRTQPNKSKVLGLVLLCFLIVASGTYAAFFLSRTSKPDGLVHPTQVVNQALIPVQKSISPTQLAVLAPPTATAQPTSQITTIPTVIPMPTPIPSPIVRQIIAIDDSAEGTGLNQFNYVGSGWGHCTGGCNGDPRPPDAYNGSNSWDNTINDYVTITFNGTQIRFYGVVGPPHGIGAISIDGGSEMPLDFYSPTAAGNTLLSTSPVLPAGRHTLQVRVTGNQNSNATWNGINPDRVDILS